MRNVLTVTRMSSADAMVVNDKIQIAVAEAVFTHGTAVVGASVVDAATDLRTATSTLERTAAANVELCLEVDVGADRCLGAIISICENVVSAYESAVVPLSEPQQQTLDSAHWLLDRCFPYGRGFIIGRWSEQFGIAEMLLNIAAQAGTLPHIECLGLTGLFDLLEKTHKVYGERMGFSALQAADIASPLFRWHEALEAYLGAVVYAQNKNPDLRDKLSAPYKSIAQAVRDARRRPRQPPLRPNINTGPAVLQRFALPDVADVDP